MPTLHDVAALAGSLPEVTEVVRYRHRAWAVDGKTFVWERPFSKADLRRFAGATPPAGTIVAVAVEDLGEKEAVLSAGSAAFFTIPHFDGYPAVLIQLDTVPPDALRTAVLDGWLACAPGRLSERYLQP